MYYKLTSFILNSKMTSFIGYVHNAVMKPRYILIRESALSNKLITSFRWRSLN